MFLVEGSPKMPFHHDYRSAVSAERPLMKKNDAADIYSSFRRSIDEHQMYSNYKKVAEGKHRFVGIGDTLTTKYIDEWNNPKIGIRSAWYVNWDKHSYMSLKKNIKQLNLVIPEWFFINPKKDTLEVRIDKKALLLMRKSGIPVMPMLTNNYGSDFRSAPIGRIMRNPVKRAKLINQLSNICSKNNFQGINLDLEELNIDDDSLLTQLVKDISSSFHNKGMYVTQEIAPFNDDYNLVSLSQYDDYFFLMAYDEHNSTSTPGPICSQQYVEKSVDWAAKKIPSDKIALGLAAYGYDWASGEDNATTVSFDQAMASADDAGAQIKMDDDTYNLDFSYRDEPGNLHQLYFTDAATLFNTMRFGTECGMAGFGLWRLGTEDDRVWQYYAKDLSRNEVPKLQLAEMMQFKGINDVDFVGQGEVLTVESEPHPGNVKLAMDTQDQLISEETYTKLPSSYTVNRMGEAGDKDLILTFDDGPDYRWTPAIIKILQKYNVPATFFMVGLQMEKNLPLVKEVYKDGYTIGNHTFTHHNIIENSEHRTYAELKLTRMLLESITGQSTTLFRAPYNADSDPTGFDEVEPMIIASRKNYMFVGESIDPNDWEVGVSADKIYKRVMEGVHNEYGHIILMHDAGGVTRVPTITALPRIIEELQKEGYHFISLEQYLGLKRSDIMPPIQKGETYYAMKANLTLAEIIYSLADFLTALFIVFLVLGFMRLIFMYFLMSIEKHRENIRNKQKINWSDPPKVSIIVPAYNEEVNIVKTISNLKEQDYPNFEIIFVDDGSKDRTLEYVQKAFDGDKSVRILTEPNSGKASALNFGIKSSDTEYIVCIDADTQLRKDAIKLLMEHFILDETHKIGAVAGNVKVGNQRNMLTRWQAIEYTTSQNFDRMAYSCINAITVVPGAIGAFRKSAIVDAGGFDTDTLAEDCDLTMRILEKGYVIENENRAVAMTEAPENVRQFVKQRTRWCFGVLQTFWKHRSSLFNRKMKGFGLWAMPNMLVFQYIIPTFSPLADLMMIIGLFSGNAWQIFIYYLIFLLVDGSVSIMAYIFEKEPLWVLLWIIPQRFFYRWIMYYVIFKSYLKAIKGELQSWGVLKRTGNVQLQGR